MYCVSRSTDREPKFPPQAFASCSASCRCPASDGCWFKLLFHDSISIHCRSIPSMVTGRCSLVSILNKNLLIEQHTNSLPSFPKLFFWQGLLSPQARTEHLLHHLHNLELLLPKGRLARLCRLMLLSLSLSLVCKNIDPIVSTLCDLQFFAMLPMWASKDPKSHKSYWAAIMITSLTNDHDMPWNNHGNHIRTEWEQGNDKATTWECHVHHSLWNIMEMYIMGTSLEHKNIMGTWKPNIRTIFS